MKRSIPVVLFLSILASAVFGQVGRQTGAIRGTISDKDGAPLPGVSIIVTSPALIGNVTDVTAPDGSFRCPGLPPGTYSIVAEMSGFKSTRQDNIVVRVAMVVTINLALEQSALNEQVTVVATSPTVDVQSLRLSTRVDTTTLSHLPLNRRFGNIITLTPGVIEDYSNANMTGMGTGEIHGGTAYSNAFEVDGVNVVDPAHNGAILFTPQYDAIEEVDIETGGLSAQVGNTGGNFVNIVTKSGGNDFHGAVNTYYSGQGLAQVLFTDEQLKALGIGKPVSPVFDYDVSGSLGGPIIKDKLWFFSTLARTSTKSHSSFIPTTILGKSYSQYDTQNSYLDAYLKLTTQLSSKLRLFVMGGFSKQDQPVASPGTYNTIETTKSRMNNRRITGTANLSWQLGSNTIVDFRGGVSKFIYPGQFTYGVQNNPSLIDGYTSYKWNGVNDWVSNIIRQNWQASARMTHYQDAFLGGDHEFAAGFEYSFGQDYWAWYHGNPMTWYYYNGNPYYYRGLYGLSGPSPTYGDGRLQFQICGPTNGGTATKPSKVDLGGYLQDNWTFKNRLTVSIGVRIDSVTGYVPAASKEASGSALAVAIGETYIRPQYGFNPFGNMTTAAWEGALKWTSITPRFGISYDIFGNGKTAVKLSLAQYAEAMPVMYFQGNHPFSQSQWGSNPLYFYWWDQNNNGQPDAPPVDRFQLYQGNVSDYDPNPDTYHQKIGKDIHAPKYNELVFGLEHELFANFRVTTKYFYREKKDAVAAVMYDRASQRFWYTSEQASDWWVPFKTTLPAYGGYPEQNVTLYFLSNNSPYANRFNLFTNVPESKRTYNALEVTFDKRYAQGWSLGGSVVISKTVGNNSGRAGSTHGFSGAYNNADWFVNKLGRTDEDRPLAIKLYGAIDVPFGFVMSFFATHYSGFPYQRTVTVYPPAAWAAANNVMGNSFAVNVEPQGTRRNYSVHNVDARLEKEFGIGKFGKLSAAIDVYNLLGNSYVNVTLDPSGNWRPSDADTTAGTFAAGGTYGKPSSVVGTRLYKLNLRLTF